MPHLDPGNAVQLDVKNDANALLELVAAFKRLRGVEKQAFVAILSQQALESSEDTWIVIDDKNELLIGQRAILAPYLNH
jgi:hypothetical protein